MSKLSALALLVIVLGAGVAHADSGAQGRLVATSGQVYVNGSPAKVGDLVPAGAKIETESGGTATLIFGSESVVHVASSSVVDVERINGNSITLSVTKGSVDGVKKTGTENVGAIVVKTDSAVFELKSGRYSVGKKEASAGASNSFVAVDGDATMTYTKDTRSGQKAGTTVTLEEGAFVLVRPSPDSSGAIVASSATKSESASNELRPSQQEVPKTEETIRKITEAIVHPETPLAETTPREPSSTTASGAATNSGGGSAANTDWGQGSRVGSPLDPGTNRGIPRDPLQPLPGLANPNVTIVFEP